MASRRQISLCSCACAGEDLRSSAKSYTIYSIQLAVPGIAGQLLNELVSYNQSENP